MESSDGYLRWLWLATEYNIKRKFREARLSMIASISNNLVGSFVGQHVLDYLGYIKIRTPVFILGSYFLLNIEGEHVSEIELP